LIIDNAEVLNQIVEILELRNCVEFAMNNRTTKINYDFNKSKFNKNFICKIYNLYSRSIFLKFFAEHHSLLDKVVPVPEAILDQNRNLVRHDDSFLFTIRLHIIPICYGKVLKIVKQHIFLNAKKVIGLIKPKYFLSI